MSSADTHAPHSVGRWPQEDYFDPPGPFVKLSDFHYGAFTVGNRSKRIRAFAFWLLLAGWICANNPQAALVATITWLQEAHRHSGHQNLNLAVAELLGGSPKAPLRMAESRKSERPDPPPATAEFTLRKLELAVETGLGELVHGDSLCDARCPLALTAESRSYPPLLGPPRRTV